MTYAWLTDSDLRDSMAMTSLPPAIIGETGWDILLALHAKRTSGLSLEKLIALVGISEAVTHRWLPALERRGLIVGSQRRDSGQIFAALTAQGREMLDRYFSATAQLQLGAAH